MAIRPNNTTRGKETNKQTAIYNAMNKLICATAIKKVDEI